MSTYDDFDERWCRLEDGSILFARIADDEVDEEAEEQGYTGCVNFTLLDCGYVTFGGKKQPAYETGQFCRKDGWSVEDFAEHNWGCRPVAFYNVVDAYDLRDAIEYEKWPLVARYTRAYPDLFGGIIPVFEQIGLL